MLYSGYAGLFKQPINPKYVSNIYCITDSVKEKLFMILLTPSSFVDAYNICKSISYTEIYFVIPSLDVLFISDIFNIYMMIKNTKPNVKWIFPDNPVIDTSVEFELGHIQTDHFVYEDFIEYEYPVIIDFTLSNNLDREFYDIILSDGKKNIYFSQYNTIEKIIELSDDDRIDEIHIPYSSTLYGGLTYYQILQEDKALAKKLVVNSFINASEHEYCIQNNIRIGEVRYHVFK